MAVVEDFEQLGERIRLFRLGVGLDQSGLASRCGLERTALTRIESGARRVSALELVHIAEALDVSILDLLSQPEPTVRAAREPIDEETAPSERERLRADAEIDRAWRDLQQLREYRLIEPVELPFGARGLGSREEALELAREVRGFLGVDDRPLERMADVAAELGLWCRTTEVDIDGSSLTPEIGFGVALIGQRLAPGRRRATVAHEIGHHISGDTYEKSGHYSTARESEALIDAFAAELLLPLSVVRKTKSPSRDDMVKLAADYRVSWSLVIAGSQKADVDLSEVDSSATPVDNDFYRVVGRKPEEDVVPPGLARKWIRACALAVDGGDITKRRAREMTLGSIEIDDD